MFPSAIPLTQQALQRLLSGRTALVIAHRLATTQLCHRVLVFHRGRLVEDGSHHQLLAQKGAYYALFHRLQAVPGGTPWTGRYTGRGEEA
ncbi:MAG: hypothetical protein NZ869_11105 [Thermoanaerobaculum sp.]|nr:hypothetical protein [Thermoanaerobaculum sp.]